MDVFSPALFQQQLIFSGTDFFWNGAAPPRGPDVEDDLAQCHRLNQSTTARCVTGRSHGYLAATATAVNMSCQMVMDENKKETGKKQLRTIKQERLHRSVNGSWMEATERRRFWPGFPGKKSAFDAQKNQSPGSGWI